MLLNFLEIPGRMLMIVPTIARSDDFQFSFVKGWSKNKWLKVSISDNTDAPIVLHLVLQQRECLIAARTFKSNRIGFAGSRKILWRKDRSCPKSRGKSMPFLTRLNNINICTTVGFEDKEGEQAHRSGAGNENSLLWHGHKFAQAFRCIAR